jgi:hypothetical protein
VYTWEVTNELRGQDARKHADYSPIARGETSGESVARRGVARVWRDGVETRGVCQVTVRCHRRHLRPIIPTYVLSFLSSTVQRNHAERYRSRQGSWRGGTWKGYAWFRSRRQRCSSWRPRTWRRPRSRWWFRTPRTGRVCDLSGVPIFYTFSCAASYSYLLESLQRANPLLSMLVSLTPLRSG